MQTDWETRYQAGDMPWEKGAPSPGLVEYLQGNPSLEGKILVPGCGWGHDVRIISTESNHVIGLDIAPSAVAGANKFCCTGNETFLQGNLLEPLQELLGAFDWVWEHTCFCALHPSHREQYVSAVAAVLKPGGHLLAIFYLDPDHDGEGPPHGVSPQELDSLFETHFELLREWRPNAAYPEREGRELMRLLQKRI